jgi:hypothetical protein
MQNTIRQFQPLRRHFALKDANVLFAYDSRHVQTVRGVARVLFVSVVLCRRHDLSAFPPGGGIVFTLGRTCGVSLFKIDHFLRRDFQAATGWN